MMALAAETTVRREELLQMAEAWRRMERRSAEIEGLGDAEPGENPSGS